MKIVDIRTVCASSVVSFCILSTAHSALLDLSDTPLFITSAAKPNVLMILDTSGSMHYDVTGGFVRGDSVASRSEIARNAAEMVIDRFGNRFNLGLMSYDQSAPRIYTRNDINGNSLNYWGGGHGGGGGRLDASISEVDTAHRTTLMNLLSTEQYSSAVDVPLRNSGGTPIEGALYSARDYFKGVLAPANGGPGAAFPESCGYNYAVLLTDGEPTTNDGGGSYPGGSDAIAECAAAAKSLREDSISAHPTTGSARYVDTFVVGFSAGVGAGALDSIAASGGTGTSYDAADGAALETSLTSIFSSISDTRASRSAATANSGTLTTSSLVYQAGFDSGSWSGSLTANGITSSNNLSSTANWDAADQYPSDWSSGREILTWNGSTGVPFQSANMTSSMQDWLNDDPATDGVDNDGYYQKRISYLRGTKASSISGPIFRPRAKALGDIVHSSPVYVGTPSFSYSDTFESQPYSAFKNANKNRRPMVYVGANDGMLHAFDATADAEVSGTKKGGTEVFSYVPKAVYPYLTELTDPSYSYHPTVDGEITVGDAFIGGSWKTVLVGGLRGGGQGYFALDITDPDSVTEANAASKVLWEYSDENNKHMGYSYSGAAIVKMANGNWAAVFGNGYNNSESDGSGTTSNHGKGVLYIVNLETGSLIKKIVVPSGTTSSPNGLATPAPVDDDGDGVVDAIFAGDLNGNLWKFKVSNSSPTKWKIAYKSGGTKIPLFSAKDSSGTAQPITTRPEVVRNPITNDLLVLFGTGKYLELSDSNPANIGTQTFYGVRDSGSLSSTMLRANLVTQEVLSTTTYNPSTGDPLEYRLVSNNTVDWAGGDKGWLLDLPDTGEMVVVNPTARNEQIIFSTAAPAADVCTVGGSGWFMEIEFLSGGRSADGVMDVDGDGVIDSSDFLAFDVNGSSVTDAVSGFQSRQGFLTTPLILTPDAIDPDNPVEYKFITGSLGGVETVTEKTSVQSSGRISWRQIR